MFVLWKQRLCVSGNNVHFSGYPIITHARSAYSRRIFVTRVLILNQLQLTHCPEFGAEGWMIMFSTPARDGVHQLGIGVFYRTRASLMSTVLIHGQHTVASHAMSSWMMRSRSKRRQEKFP